VQLDANGITRRGRVSGAEIYVDGWVGGVDTEVLRQRRLLGQGGFVSVVVTVDQKRRAIVDGPTVVSRGWSTDDDVPELHGYVEKAVRDGLARVLAEPDTTREAVERVVRRTTGSTVADRTRRRPVIVPVVRFVD
jgi:ribonuclease J